MEELQISGKPIQLTKKTMADFAESVKLAVVNGELDGLKALIHLKYMEKVAKEAYSNILSEAIDSASKSPNSHGVLDGAKFQVKKGGKFVYDHIPDWANNVAMRKTIEERAKQAYEMRQSGMEMVDEETGELVIAAEYKDYAETVAISF